MKVYMIETLDGTYMGFICSTPKLAQLKCEELVKKHPHMSYVYIRVTLDQ